VFDAQAQPVAEALQVEAGVCPGMEFGRAAQGLAGTQVGACFAGMVYQNNGGVVKTLEGAQESQQGSDLGGDGDPFEMYMSEHVLRPAGMARATFAMPGEDQPDRAMPYVRRHGRLTRSAIYPYHRAQAPNGTLHASAEELARWLCVMLDRGVTPDGGALLPRQVLEEMWLPQRKIGFGKRVGFGWFILQVGSRRLVSHSGGDVGYTAAIQFAPERGFGWVILANREYAPLQNISHRVMGMLAHTH